MSFISKVDFDAVVERAEAAEKECLHQARLLGLSGERELALQSKMNELVRLEGMTQFLNNQILELREQRAVLNDRIHGLEQQVHTIDAENERLREALELILMQREGFGEDNWRIFQIAAEALEIKQDNKFNSQTGESRTPGADALARGGESKPTPGIEEVLEGHPQSGETPQPPTLAKNKGENK